jgi:hypothetical protein
MAMTPELRKAYAERQTTVYADSPATLQAWKDRAAKAGLSLNALINEVMRQSIEGTGISQQTDVEDAAIINELKAEIHDLREQLKNANLEIERSRDAWKTAHVDAEKLREFREKIMEHLQQGGVWKPGDLNLRLKFNDIRATSMALRDLTDLDLIIETNRGYKIIKK